MWARAVRFAASAGGYHRAMIGRIGNIVAKVLDGADYLITLVRLSILGRRSGPPPETLADAASRERSERLREAFSEVDFDDPRRHAR
jgi:hypothetical protein